MARHITHLLSKAIGRDMHASTSMPQLSTDRCSSSSSSKLSARLSFAEKAFVETHGGNDGLEFCMMLLYSLLYITLSLPR